MSRPPRRADEPLLSGYLLWRIAFVSAALVAGTMGLFALERYRGIDLETARTVAVNALVMFEVVYLVNCRTLNETAFSRRILHGAGYSMAAIAIVVALQLLLTYTAPLQFLFDTRAIGLHEWLRVLTAAVVIFILVEMVKTIVRRLGAGPVHAAASAGQLGSDVRPG